MRARWTLFALFAVLVAAPLAGCGGAGTARRGEVRVLFVGDTSFGENYQSDAGKLGGVDLLRKKGYDWPLGRLKPLLREADIVIANLETPLTDQVRSPLAGKKEYVHWSDVKKAPAALARHNIKVVSLANNHAVDFGLEGLGQTLKALRSAGIASFGAGVDEAAAARPYAKTLSVGGRPFSLVVLAGYEYRQKYEAVYKFYARGKRGGVNRLDFDKLCLQIEKLKRASPTAFVAVTPHWGRNYGSRRKREVEGARRLIDAGADLVMGHGAHHLQAIEHYKGRWIFYNLGNFMFSAEGRRAEKKSHGFSLAVRLNLSPGSDGIIKTLRAYPILTDNLRTGYRSRPVTARELEQVRKLLRKRSPDSADFRRQVRPGRDRSGHYVEMTLQ